MFQENKNTVITLLILAVVIVFIGFYLYQRQTPEKEEVYRANFDEGVLLIGKGDERARYKFEEALRSATTVEEEAVAKLNVGTAYWFSDPVKAVQILKEVYANTSYPSRIRAGAIDYMVQYYSSNFDLDLVKNHMFAGGQPWESFLVNEGDAEFVKRDATLSMRKAQEHASSINSAFTLEYGIAYIYSAYELLENDKNKKIKIVDRYASTILDRIDKGDRDLNSKLGIEANVRDSQYAWGLFYKALALTNLYDVGVYKDIVKIQDAFKNSIIYQEKVPRTPVAHSARLAYLLFLGRLNALDITQKTIKEEINNQLSEWFDKGLGKEQESKDVIKDYLKDARYIKYFGNAAELDPRFKDLITSFGWKGG